MRAFAAFIIAVGFCPFAPALVQANPQPWADFEGRWQQEEEDSALPLGTLELASCGAKLCGRLVKEGKCGPIILRVKRQKPQPDEEHRLEGRLQFDERRFDALLWKSEATRLVVAGFEKTGSIYKRGLSTDTGLIAAGPAQCQ